MQHSGFRAPPWMQYQAAGMLNRAENTSWKEEQSPCSALALTGCLTLHHKPAAESCGAVTRQHNVNKTPGKMKSTLTCKFIALNTLLCVTPHNKRVHYDLQFIFLNLTHCLLAQLC